MIKFIKSPWRPHFAELLERTNRNIVITSPYIKRSEADFICKKLEERGVLETIQFKIITDFCSKSILDNALDIEALQTFQSHILNVQVYTLPRLHAKTYIFDNFYAIVGSANLTPSGFQYNHEYSVGFSEESIVSQINADIEEYSKLGSLIEKPQIDELSVIANELKIEYNKVSKSATTEIIKEFSVVLQKANLKFTEASVGQKTAYSVFKNAVIFILAKQALSTQELHERIKLTYPDLCVEKELIIKGQKFGKAWKHQVRTVLNDLRRKGLIVKSKKWELRQ